MKVVCIKYPPTFVELKIKVGEITECHMKTLGNPQRDYLFTIDSDGNNIPCDALDNQEYFITLEKFRDMKLKQLGI